MEELIWLEDGIRKHFAESAAQYVVLSKRRKASDVPFAAAALESLSNDELLAKAYAMAVAVHSEFSPLPLRLEDLPREAQMVIHALSPVCGEGDCTTILAAAGELSTLMKVIDNDLRQLGLLSHDLSASPQPVSHMRAAKEATVSVRTIARWLDDGKLTAYGARRQVDLRELRQKLPELLRGRSCRKSA